MKVAFRVDAGTAMGGGHLSRCLTVANALILNGVSKCFFILKSHQGNFISTIKNCGFELEILELEFKPDYTTGNYEQWVGGCIVNDAKCTLSYLKKNGFTSRDCLIIDHYGLDYKFEKIIFESGINIGVIDDLVNRQHSCNFLVDQTCGRQDSEYRGLVSCDTDLMTGEEFCILRPEFLLYRERSLMKRTKFKKIKNIFINFGSTDPTNVTCKIIDILNLANFKSQIKFIIAVGRNTQNISKIKDSVMNLSGESVLVIDAKNMSQLMYEADIAIGAAGTTTWERCALGLPSIIIKTAENQSTVITRIVEFGVAVLHDLGVKDQPNELLKHIENIQDNYLEMSKKCSTLIAGDGIFKVVKKILSSGAK